MKKSVLLFVLVMTLVMAASVLADGEPQYGGTLRFAIPTLSHLDTNSIAGEYEAYQVMFETLFGRGKDGQPEPLLVKEYEVSDDGKEYIFHLQEGVKFHDGTPFNAEAVKWNLDRKINNQLPYYSNIPWDTIEVLDEYTVRVTLTRHYLAIMYYLSNASYSMYSPTFVESHTDEDLKNQACGTGPFKLESFDPNNLLRVVKNEDYWQEGKPYLDAIEFYIVNDTTTRMMMLESGEVDLIKDLTVPELQYLEDMNYDFIEFSYGPSTRTHYVTMHNQYEPLNLKEVRQAFNYAIDKEALLSAIFHNIYTIETDLFCSNPMTNGYHEETPYPYDPEKAKELMDSVGFVDTDGDGFRDWNGEPREFNIYSMKGRRFGDIEIAENVQAYLKDVGVNLRIDIVDAATYMDILNQPFGEAPHYDLSNQSPTSNGDKEFTVNNYLSCDAWPGTLYNYSHYCNEDVQKLILESREAVTFEARNAIYDVITDMIWEDAPAIFLVDAIYSAAYNSKLTNIFGMPNSTNWLIREAYYEK